MQLKTALLTLAATALVVAKDETTTTAPYFGPEVSFWQPTYSGTAGSVAGINAKETTYHISCTKDAPKSLCQIDKPWTMIQAQESWSLTGVYTAWSSEKDAVTATQDYSCTFKHWSESASCALTVKATGTWGGGSWSSSTSTKVSVASDKVTTWGLLVTGGVESFTMPQATQTPGAAAIGAPVNARAVATGLPLAGAAAVAVAAMF
ncbi:hypothetical protein BDV38DRAFT_219230 [Aspergillus pseudotamarii]|uniref:Uncharacterized protein n=1 Tax=Aspergillus pseudotamarii TaxID=132259 RepID=A0A5N6T411_ASPPS|nr:uncharacterized protein BDV38DRAFT_219230 [Aspergillus pseudotamarii]KAE8141032.1 hypothetical protein BDV38DRAFT_219230 [Aspergillus pseudotamarii]